MYSCVSLFHHITFKIIKIALIARYIIMYNKVDIINFILYYLQKKIYIRHIKNKK